MDDTDDVVQDVFLERLHNALRSSSTPFIVVSEDSLSAADLELVRARGGSFTVYHNLAHEAQRAFANFGTPAFYVLDDAGRVRFEWARPDDIHRDLAVLRPLALRS